MKTQKTITGKVDPEVLSFTVGKDPELDKELAGVDCIGTAAHVTMLSKIKLKKPLLTVQEAKKVVKELGAIMKKAKQGSLKISSKDQDIHLAIERILTKKLGDTGRRVHTARSRNDQVALDLRLYGKEQLFGMIDDVCKLADAILKFAAKNKDVPMVGRTHMQPAMPSSVGLWAAAHAESLIDDLGLLKNAYDFNDKSPLGSAAGFGVALNIDRKLTSDLLGFREPINNVLYASNSRGKCESVILSALSQVMVSISRLAQDMILYSMPEFGYFSLPKEYCTGSSIMPQKNNPDALELIRAKAVRIISSSSAAAGIVSNLPAGYSRDLQEIKELFIDGINVTGSSVRVLTLLMKKVKVHKKALLAGFTPQVFATDIVFEGVMEGDSFRDAYNHVKDHIDELDQSVVAGFLSSKHQSSTRKPDVLGLSRKVDAFVRKTAKAKKGYEAKISKLLGCKYTL